MVHQPKHTPVIRWSLIQAFTVKVERSRVFLLSIRFCDLVY